MENLFEFWLDSSYPDISRYALKGCIMQLKKRLESFERKRLVSRKLAKSKARNRVTFFLFFIFYI